MVVNDFGQFGLRHQPPGPKVTKACEAQSSLELSTRDKSLGSE